jgi:uncharacterized protein YkwD
MTLPMRKLLPTLITLLLLGAPLAQGDGPLDETRLTLRGAMLRMINRDRKQFGLRPLELDAQASTLADAYCAAQIRNHTTGHFTVDGQAPYMRYSFGGGNDGVSENAAAWSASYKFTDAELYAMMRRSEDAMMAEVAPHDGHRRTILDPNATAVGIGLAWERGEFRMTQEFIRRYLEWPRPLPRSASTTDRVLCNSRPVAGYGIEAITVHYEAPPQAISARTANAIETYSLPSARREYVPRIPAVTHRVGDMIETISRRGDFTLARDGSCSFAVPFPDGAGVYTVVVWVKKTSEREAFPASNVSIRVDAAAGGALSMYSSR